MRRSLGLFLVASVLVACSSTSSPAPVGSSSSGGAGVDAAVDSGPVDAGGDGGGGIAACDAACQKTALLLTMNGKTDTFLRAQFGTTGKPATSLHVEAFIGGDVACPSNGSKTPDRTAIIDGVVPFQDATLQVDGITGAFLDFKGDIVTTANPSVKATRIEVKPVAISLAPLASAFVALDITATYANGGTLTGHLYATHCDSMDE